MFRVQFSGSCREEMEQHCCSCVQKLSQYVPVQGPEEQLGHGLSQDTQAMDTEHVVSDHTYPKTITSAGRPAQDDFLTALRPSAGNRSWEISCTGYKMLRATK